jgi:hypothetical protein
MKLDCVMKLLKEFAAIKMCMCTNSVLRREEQEQQFWLHQCRRKKCSTNYNFQCFAGNQLPITSNNFWLLPIFFCTSNIFCVVLLLFIFALSYILFILCRSVYYLCINVYSTTATGWLPNFN